MDAGGFVAKIEWEGGIESAIEYGLTPADADDPNISDSWALIVDQYEGRAASGKLLSDLYADLLAYVQREMSELG
jgi:hypothetical protein